MTANHDLDRQLDAFLLDGPTSLPDASFDAVRDRTEQTRQRVVLGPWRVPTVSKLVPIGLGAAAVIAVLFLGSRFIGSPSSDVGGPSADPGPTPQPSVAAPSAAPTAAADGPVDIGPLTIANEPLSTTVTVPASGWTYDSGIGAIGKGTEVANLPEAALLAWTWAPGSGFFVYGDPCQWKSTTPDTPTASVDDIVAALAAQPSRDASDPEDVTIGGYAGKHVILHVPDDADFAVCDEGNFASYGSTEETGPARFHQGPGQIDELWVVDVDGAVAILDAMYRPDSPAELVEEMRGIAESATFDAP